MDNPNQVPRNNKQQTEHFESDTDRIIHRHLADENDIITEEDIRNVRIGVTPPAQDVENEKEDFAQQAEKAANASDDHSQEQTENPTTPWDVVEP